MSLVRSRKGPRDAERMSQSGAPDARSQSVQRDTGLSPDIGHRNPSCGRRGQEVPAGIRYTRASAVLDCVLALLLSLVTTAQVGAQTNEGPILRLAFVTRDVGLSPVNRVTPIAVGPYGSVMLRGFDDSGAGHLELADSTGHLLLQFGRDGAGPGETREPDPVAITDSTLVAWDVGLQRLDVWSIVGKAIETLLPDARIGVLGMRDTTLFVNIFSGSTPSLGLWTIHSTHVTRLAIQDTFLANHFSGPTLRHPYPPTIGTWDHGYIVGDANDYRLAFFGDDGILTRVIGRNLPSVVPSKARTQDFVEARIKQLERNGHTMSPDAARELTKRMLDQPLPFFTPLGLIGRDTRERIWVLGMEGDSAFADVFTPTGFVSRLHVSCRFFNGSWSMNGRWLALVCAPDDPGSSLDAVIKLFRIVG